jgi:AcrR family transcriptional regulator
MSTDDTRSRILTTASTHFAHYGFEGASLRRIAEDAGIKAASIFHHFPGGKSELFDQIFEEISETISARIVLRYGADEGLSPVDAIVLMAAAFWDYFAEHPDYAKLILLRASGMDRSFAATVEGQARAIVDSARAFISEMQARGELGAFDIEQFMLWSSAHTLTVHGAPFLSSFLYPEDPEKRLRASYIAMVRAYVRPKTVRRGK